MSPPPPHLRPVPDAPDSDETILVRVSVEDKVDALIEDQRGLAIVVEEARDAAQEARSEAAQAKGIAGRIERVHGTALGALVTAVEDGRRETRAVGDSVADLGAAMLLREAREAELQREREAEARALAVAEARSSANKATAVGSGVLTVLWLISQIVAALRGG